MSTIYERLGVRPIVNGVGTVTRLGGSLMPPPVLEAMLDAARYYVPLQELQAAAGRRLAELTRNEAAYVASGAAAGLVLATAACVTGNDPARMALLPRPDRIAGGRHKVVVYRSQRNSYDFAVRQVGIELVEIGPARAQAGDRSPDPAELARALDDRTAAVVFFAGEHFARGALPVEQVVEIAHARRVPVIVDAAAQIPPVENLWKFTGKGGPAPWAQALARLGISVDGGRRTADRSAVRRPPSAVDPVAAGEAAFQVTSAGADLAIFSGGKGLCGPQSTGLIVGRADLIAAIARQGNPNQLIGRPMKVGKEEICGLVAAVEWYLALDFEALAARYEQQVQHVIDAVSDVPGVVARRDWPNEAGQPMPRALITLTGEAPLTRDALQQRLLAGDPPVELSAAGADGVYVNPQNLREGDEVLVADALRRALEGPFDPSSAGRVGSPSPLEQRPIQNPGARASGRSKIQNGREGDQVGRSAGTRVGASQ
jgi:L-seryl-tRNA(Ser) seleniumtransferase